MRLEVEGNWKEEDSGLVWSGLVWYGMLLSSPLLSLLLLDVSSFKRSLIKVQLQVKLKHDDNVAGSPPPPQSGKKIFLRIGGRSWMELKRS